MPAVPFPRPAARPGPPSSGRPRPGSLTAQIASETLVRAYCALGLVWSLLLAGVASLTPQGTGWKWGDPLTELRWYATGLGSPTTMAELFGNLALLALPAAFAVRIWPGLGRLPLLVAGSLAAGASIETLQWLLAIGRVVSPLDALLNAGGAILATRLLAHLRRYRTADR
jgi:hypothetical protein